jgi:hypothetical protein
MAVSFLPFSLNHASLREKEVWRISFKKMMSKAVTSGLWRERVAIAAYL